MAPVRHRFDLVALLRTSVLESAGLIKLMQWRSVFRTMAFHPSVSAKTFFEWQVSRSAPCQRIGRRDRKVDMFGTGPAGNIAAVRPCPKPAPFAEPLEEPAPLNDPAGGLPNHTRPLFGASAKLHGHPTLEPAAQPRLPDAFSIASLRRAGLCADVSGGFSPT